MISISILVNYYCYLLLLFELKNYQNLKFKQKGGKMELLRTIILDVLLLFEMIRRYLFG